MSDPQEGIPTTNTSRLVLNYTGLMGQRSILFRFNSTIDPLTAGAAISAFWAALAPLRHTSVVATGMDWYPQGSAFSQPLGIAPSAGTNAEPFAAADYPEFISVTGRDLFGVRTRYTLYGIPTIPAQADYRLTQAESPLLWTFRQELGDLVNQEGLVTVGNNAPSLNSYINVGFNSYYQRKARRTG